MARAFIYTFVKILPHGPPRYTMSHSPLMPRTLVSPHSPLPGHTEMTESGWQDAWRGTVTHPWLGGARTSTGLCDWQVAFDWLIMYILYCWSFSFFLWDGKSSQCYLGHLNQRGLLLWKGRYLGPRWRRHVACFGMRGSQEVEEIK